MRSPAPLGCLLLVAAFAAGLLMGLLVPSTTGREPSRPATRVAIPAAPMGVVEPDRRVWRTRPAPPSAMPSVAAVPAATAAPRHQPDVRPVAVPKATPGPAVRPRNGRSGQASYVAASYGADYLAARLRKGVRLRVCGPAGCTTGTVSDYGPSRRIFPKRIVDLSAARFIRVCGPLAMGVCDVQVWRA